MKTKRISKKLSLNHTTVTNLDGKQMAQAKGGDLSQQVYVCDTDYYVCGTGICVTVAYPCPITVYC